MRAVRATHRIPVQSLRPLMAEYMDIIQKMARLQNGQNSPQLEALDIAKRITHDEAGELVQSMLPSIRPTHGTARRIFTLLVTLFHDTTRNRGRAPGSATIISDARCRRRDRA